MSPTEEAESVGDEPAQIEKPWEVVAETTPETTTPAHAQREEKTEAAKKDEPPTEPALEAPAKRPRGRPKGFEEQTQTRGGGGDGGGCARQAHQIDARGVSEATRKHSKKRGGLWIMSQSFSYHGKVFASFLISHSRNSCVCLRVESSFRVARGDVRRPRQEVSRFSTATPEKRRPPRENPPVAASELTSSHASPRPRRAFRLVA